MSKDRENMAKSNLKAFLFLLLVLVSFCSFLALISPFLSAVIFAGKFQGMEFILPLYAFMFMPYAMIYFLINFYIISQKLFYSAAIFIGVVLQYSGIVLFHRDLFQVSFVVGAVGYAVLVVLMIDSFLWHKRKKVFNFM
jgi:O-antigen/teichoic acid export membrane protein